MVNRWTFTDKAGNEQSVDATGLKDAIAKLPEGYKPDLSKAPRQETIAAPKDQATTHDLAGDQIDKEWTAFSPESQSLGIPRAEMPQVKAEHRGALTQFLKAKDITSTEEEVLPGTLKPTQAEFSQAKVDKARGFTGGDRAILVSQDGHVIDGHHQWMAKLTDEPNKPMRVIRLDAPIKDLLAAVKEFPSAETAGGATAAGKPAPAEFLGIEGEGTKKAFETYRLTEDIPGHVKGSSVSRKTLEDAGFNVPARPGATGKEVTVPPVPGPNGESNSLSNELRSGVARVVYESTEGANPENAKSLEDYEMNVSLLEEKLKRGKQLTAADMLNVGDDSVANASWLNSELKKSPENLVAALREAIDRKLKPTSQPAAQKPGSNIGVSKPQATAKPAGKPITQGPESGAGSAPNPRSGAETPLAPAPVVARGQNNPASFTKAVTTAAKNKAGDRASKAVASWAKILHRANPKAFGEMEVHALTQAQWDAHEQTGVYTPDSAGAYDPSTNTLYINADKSSGEQIVNTIVHEGGHFAEKFYLGEEFTFQEYKKLTSDQRHEAMSEYLGRPATMADWAAPGAVNRARSEWVTMQIARVVKKDTAGMSNGLKAKIEKFLTDIRELVTKWVGGENLSTPALDAKILEMLGGKEEAKPDVAKTATTPRQGKVGDMLESGEVVLTSGGRQTTPFPTISTGTDRKTTATARRVDAWLMNNAIAEATVRGDDFNRIQFSQPRNGGLSQADKDGMEEYLFGEQPPVLKPLLKPLAPKSNKPSNISDEADKALDDAFDGLLGTPADNSQQAIPEDKIPLFMTAAKALIKSGITTPEGLAQVLETKYKGAVRKYSEALWDAFGMAQKSLRGTHDWNAIYGAIDNPGKTEDVAPSEPSPQSPEAGNGQSPRVESRPERTGDRAGVGEQQPGAGPAVGGGQQPSAEGEGSAGTGGRVASESEGRRDDASGGSRNLRDLRGSKSESRVTSAGNYVITPEDQIGSGGLRTKYRDNIAAIKLLKQITSENRPATVAEQRILVRYVGWGGLKFAFNASSKDWSKEFAELKGLLTDGEYKAARATVQDAHYTSETVITRGIYSAMRRFGFTGGNMVEGGVGLGHFIGLMPAEMRGPTSYLGVERDQLTAKIAQLLYPQARILNQSFQDSNLAPGSFDAAVGNPPFGDKKVFDKNFKEASKHSIHNFFILKQLELLRPGGVAGFVVSRYFMDAQDSSAREAIAAKAEFLGAIRLPNTAFKQNANTEVTTDIVFFRRVPDGQATKQDWVTAVQVKDAATGKTFTMNGWLNARPDMMLGKMGLTGSMYTDAEPTLEPKPNQDLGADLTAAVANLPQNIYQPGDPATTKRLSEPNPLPPGSVPSDAKVGGYFADEKGNIHRRLSDVNEERRSAPVTELKEGAMERIKAILPVRDALNRLVKAEFDAQSSDTQLAILRKTLNKVYDAFVNKFGYLNQPVNRRAFYDDPESARLLGLESNYDVGVSAMLAKKNGVSAREPSAQKAAIFSKRVNAPYTEVTSVETANEALAVSLNQRGEVDLEYMAQLSGKSPAALVEELGGLIFNTPRGGYQSKDQYLSGNVRQKLAEAQIALSQTQDPQWKRNIDALQAVIPADIPATDIAAPVGAPWVPASDVTQFAREITARPPDTVLYRKHDGGWLFRHEDNSVASTQTYGTARANFGEIFGNLLNGRPTLVYDKDSEGKAILNQQETALAAAKAEEIKAKWEEWIWQDQDRRDRLARFYNDNFNNYVDPDYDGSHLTLPGSNPAVQLRQHQKNVIWRTITDRRVLYDHVVGAGKTFAGIGSFMEMRRMGRVRKPLFVVPNHLTGQWRDEFLKLYPSANVLSTQPADFDKDSRGKLFAKILTGEYDAIIIGHSQFKKIGVSPEIEKQLLQEMVAEISEAIEAMKTAEGRRGRSSRPVANAEKTKDKLEERLKKLAEVGERDTVATFEELGIDGLFVDEAHEFKNLFYTTQMQRVAGLGNAAGSQKAFDLYLKTRYLQRRFSGKAPLVFATGTPISNSLVEMFTMQRYLQGEVLESMGLKSLDAWAKVFGEVAHVYEVDPTGTGYRMATRLAQFQNVGELSALYRTVADVITMTDLEEQAQVRGERFPVPKVKGGKPTNFVADRTKEQSEYFGIEKQEVDEAGNPKFDAEGNPVISYPPGTILHRVDHMPNDPRVDNMLKLTNDARKAGLDMRLIDPSMPDRPESKINKAVSEITDIYEKWTADKGTQLVFCDLSVPSSARGKATKKAREQADEFYFREAVIPGGGTRLQAIEGAKPVELPGFTDFKFFSYKNERGLWVVVERTTGKSVGVAESTMKAAVEAAAARMVNIKNFADIIKQQAQPEEMVAQARGEWEASQETAKAETEQPEGEQGVSVDELLADQSKFSVYDDMKAKLIAAGIPQNEIAFIHDYDTPDKKAKLFKAMNRGDIRILFGSTPKLGAGTNVQERLVALHHLDAPWRPSDLEQREGRIVRQGNLLYMRDPDGFEVTLNRYATKQTYDTRMWQILEHKARGIEGFRKADRSTRRIADVSGEAANASDMKAAASGDPLIQREIELRNERQKLELLKKAWTNNRHEMQGRAKWLQESQTRHKSAVDLANERIAQRQAKPDPFTFTKADGTVHEGKDGMAQIVAEAVKAAAAVENKKGDADLGAYRGFSISVQRNGFSGGKGFSVFAKPASGKGNWSEVTNYTADDTISDVGFVQRVDNWLDNFDAAIESADRVLANEQKQLADTTAELAKPFAQDSKLTAVREEHEKTRTELMNKKKRPAPAPAPQPPADSGPMGTPPVRGTARQEEVLNKVTGTLEDKRTFGEKITDYIADLGDYIHRELQQKLLDRFTAIKRLERAAIGTNELDASVSAYKWSRLTSNLAGVMEYLMKHGQIAYRGGSMVMSPGTKSLVDILKPVVESGKLRLWEGYVAAFRANRLLAEGKEKNFGKRYDPATDTWSWDRTRAQDEINALLELGRDYPEFEQVRQDYVAFQKSVLDLATAAGLIDPVKRAMWERSDYVPFYRIVEALDGKDATKGPSRRRGFSGQTAGIRQLKGGPQQVAILENIFRNIEQLVDASFKNIAMQRIADLADQNTDLMVKIPYKSVPFKVSFEETVAALEKAGVDTSSLTQPEIEEMVTFWRMRAPEGKDIAMVMNGGKPSYYRVKDKPLLRSIMALGPDQHSWWMKALMQPKHMLTTLVTLDPAFMAANTIRDSFSAWVIADTPIKPGWDAMRGFAKSLANDPVKLGIMVNGGGTGHYNNVQETEVRQSFLRMTREERDGFLNSIIDSPMKLARLYRDIGRASENANRIAIADSATKRGASPAEAAFQALDIMDFGLRGDSKALAFFLDTVPFMNARIQGLYRLGRGLMNDPKRVATHGAMILGATLALLGSNWDDDRYWDLPDWDRDMYYHLWIAGRHIRIPKPFEVGQIFSTMPERMFQFVAKDGDGNILKKRILSMIGDTFAMNPIPQAFKPLAERAMNRNLLTGGKIISQGDEFKSPEQQYNNYTSALSREIAQAAPDNAPEWLRSPKTLDFLIRGYTGTLGMYAMDVADAIVRPAAGYPDKPAAKAGDYWLAKRFIPEGDLRDSKYISEFYNLNQDVSEIMAKAKALRENGDLEEAAKVTQENRGQMSYEPVLKSTAKALSAIRQRERQIYQSDTLTREQKREELARLEEQKNRLAKQTVTRAPDRPSPIFNPFK